MIIIEHDPLLYEDAQGMVEYVSQGLHDAAKEATLLLYSPGTDTFLEDLTKMPTEYSTSMMGQEQRQSLSRNSIIGSEEPDTTRGLDFILKPMQKSAKLLELKRMANPRHSSLISK